MVVVSELEADDRMANILWSPRGEEKVCVTELRKVNRPVAPAIRVIGLGAVVAVTQIVDRDPIPVDLDRGGSSRVSLPITLVRRLQAEPPRQHNTEACETQSGR